MGSRATKSHSTETLVFADKDHDFRIPALLYVKEWNTFLAFAEKRTSSKDEHAENLVMRKGSRQPDGSLQWSPTEDLMKASIDGFRTMNPCPVFERNSGTLFLFFICLRGTTLECMLKPGQTRLCYVTSVDRGQTWSDHTDLTSSVMDATFDHYQTFAVGPGHGIQLRSGTLLVPAYVKLVEGCRQYPGLWCCCGGCECVSTHSVVLRSHDLLTWHAGQPVATETGECQLAEVFDGEGRTQVYLNARSTGEWRVEALSGDGGDSFTPLSHLALPEVGKGCQGSVVSFPARELPAGEGASAQTALLFSHPTAGQDWDRLELGVHLRSSLQDHHPWGEPHIIHPGRSGYSDLARCEAEGRFTCLMECGEGGRLQMVFREFDLTEILHIV
ncbi:sialidase-3-like [Alosa sapidissima]|uniref:sialidase-3-like n=1 Tax=Alosa sapidissima TaxID=34773 RepID=UPI001C090179|nr:sialidase-3-like [Alosa sapidissima]